MTWCPWHRYCTPVTLLWFYIDSSIKKCFCEGVTAASVKPCIVVDILFKHTLWPGALDSYIALQWLCHDFTLSSIWVHFSVPVIAVCVKPSVVQAPNWPCALDLDFALQWLQWLCPLQVQRWLPPNSCFSQTLEASIPYDTSAWLSTMGSDVSQSI